MKATLFRTAALAAVLMTLQPPAPAGAQDVDATERLFAEACAECHSNAQSGRTPSRASLTALSPRAIVAALDDGVMRAEGEALSDEQRIALGEYLSQRPFTADLLPEVAYCSSRGFGPLDASDVSWMGYGANLEGTGFQPADRAGLTAADVPDLTLKWAFAFPDASQARTKATVVDGTLLVGDQFGYLYAIEAESGCVRWTFEADSGLRSAILVGADERGAARAYFTDYRTSAYALDVETGEVVWKTRVGWHPESNNTGSPALAGNRMIVPISSMEVARGGDPTYECCTSSGAVAAVDVTTGYVDWYYRVIPGYPEEVGTNERGTKLWAPSGAPVWASPTVDLDRGVVYIGTGENYTRPTSASSDAITAVDLETGELVWSFQAFEADAFTMGCTTRSAACPSPPGPDVDFGMAPMLVERADGKEILVAGQKSGVVWALDPDADGAVLWSTHVGKGGALGGIHWGMATDGRLAYAPNADRGAVIVDIHPDKEPSPGLYGIDLATGDVVWSAPAPTDTCEGRRGCFAANSAAPTVIPGVVFAGGLDGRIRAHSTVDGSVVWAFDTARDYETVNGVPGRGGAIDGPGPVVAGGLLLVNSGYGSFSQMPGNVLLAFEVPGR